MQKLIDTHFHLDHYPDHKTIYKRINDLQQYTLCVTNQPEVFESCMDLYPQTNYVKFAMGYNPQWIGKVDFNKKSFVNNLWRTKYIGEVGLDFTSKYRGTYTEQQDIFQFICAHSAGNIMSIHCRNAEEYVYKTLVENSEIKSILHWYTGTANWVERFISIGCYFSVNGSMVINDELSSVIKTIPFERILIESDGPYSKVNGKKFKVDDLKATYQIVGESLNIPDIQQLVYRNFRNLLLS